MRIVTGLLLICLAMLVAVGGLMLVQRLCLRDRACDTTTLLASSLRS